MPGVWPGRAGAAGPWPRAAARLVAACDPPGREDGPHLGCAARRTARGRPHGAAWPLAVSPLAEPKGGCYPARMESPPPPPAPGWLVRLAGHDFDLGHWQRALRPPFEPWCERVERGAEVVWALRSRDFESPGTAAEVREMASPLIDRLNGALAVSARAKPVRFDAVGRVDDRGEMHLTVSLEGAATVRASASGIIEVRDADGDLVPPLPPQPSTAQKWLELAGWDDDVADMLVFAGRADDWFDIYKALELAGLLAKRRHGRRANGKEALLRSLGDASAACKNM